MLWPDVRRQRVLPALRHRAEQPIDIGPALPCPNCRVAMRQIMLKVTPLQECQKCFGIWVDQLSFDRICADREKQADVLASDTAAAADRAGAGAISPLPQVRPAHEPQQLRAHERGDHRSLPRPWGLARPGSASFTGLSNSSRPVGCSLPGSVKSRSKLKRRKPRCAQRRRAQDARSIAVWDEGGRNFPALMRTIGRIIGQL